MTQTTEPLGIITTYRDWTIKRTGDGIICLDPQGRHIFPGACSHETVKDAKKSVDYFIMANGNVHMFWLLHGQMGHDAVTSHNSIMNVTTGNFDMYCGKRDNAVYRPTYEYEHQVAFNKEAFKLSIRTKPQELLDMSPESALQLSNLLRQAALEALAKS